MRGFARAQNKARYVLRSDSTKRAEAAMSEGRQIRVYDYVNQPFERVRAALLEDATAIFSRATSVAGERAHKIASGLRINVAGLEIRKEIEIEVSGFRETEHAGSGFAREARIALHWKAAADAGLFPTMKAELALYPLSSTETQLDLTGLYTPPLGPLGAALDALIGHRVAEACVHQFVVDVAEQLRRELAQ
jgi:hypothetical protein